MIIVIPREVAYRLQNNLGTTVNLIYRRNYDDARIILEIQPVAENDIDKLIADAVISTIKAFIPEA